MSPKYLEDILGTLFGHFKRRGGVPTMHLGHFPDILGTFRMAHPETRPNTFSGHFNAIFALLAPSRPAATQLGGVINNSALLHYRAYLPTAHVMSKTESDIEVALDAAKLHQGFHPPWYQGGTWSVPIGIDQVGTPPCLQMGVPTPQTLGRHP